MYAVPVECFFYIRYANADLLYAGNKHGKNELIKMNLTDKGKQEWHALGAIRCFLRHQVLKSSALNTTFVLRTVKVPFEAVSPTVKIPANI